MTCQEVAAFYERIRSMASVADVMTKTTVSERDAVRRHYTDCGPCRTALIERMARLGTEVGAEELAEIGTTATLCRLHDLVKSAQDEEIPR